jgi:hypothetical protein
MAQVDRPSESTLTAAIKLVTSMLDEHGSRAVMQADPQEPVDCVALLDLIEAAQRVYTKHCPILSPAE